MVYTLKEENMLTWKPTIDRYVIKIFIYDNNINNKYTYVNNKNHIAYVTFQNTCKKNYITWNLKPCVDMFSMDEYCRINQELKKYKTNYDKYFKKITENYFYNKYPNLL